MESFVTQCHNIFIIQHSATAYMSDSKEGVELSQLSDFDKQNLIGELSCSISSEIYLYPVKASDGQIYERDELIKWLNVSMMSPLTREPITTIFTEDVETKIKVNKLLEKYPECKAMQYCEEVVVDIVSRRRNVEYTYEMDEAEEEDAANANQHGGRGGNNNGNGGRRINPMGFLFVLLLFFLLTGDSSDTGVPSSTLA